MSASRGFADVPPDLFERGVRNPTVAVLEEILNGLSWQVALLPLLLICQISISPGGFSVNF